MTNLMKSRSTDVVNGNIHLIDFPATITTTTAHQLQGTNGIDDFFAMQRRLPRSQRHIATPRYAAKREALVGSDSGEAGRNW
jgi:hypothetical protein